MSLGYNLPGSTFTEITKALSYTSTSARRRACAIGVASPYKKVTNEPVIRSAAGDDSLAFSEQGIAAILSVGSQKWLSNFIEGTHFSVVDKQKLMWLPKVYNKEALTITDIVTPLNYNTQIGNAVFGSDETSGYMDISTAPSTIAANAPHGIVAGTYTLRVNIDNTGVKTLSIAVSASTDTWATLVTTIQTALGSDATVVIQNGKLRFASAKTGTSSSVLVTDGISNGLFSAINRIGTYSAEISVATIGADAKRAKSSITLSNYYLVDSMLTNLPAGTYTFGAALNGAAASDKSITLAAQSTWGDVVSAINGLEGVACELIAGALTIETEATGTSASIKLSTAAAGSDLVAALVTAGYTGAAYVTSTNLGSVATAAYASIDSSPTAMINGVKSRIASGTYYIKINANGAGEVEYPIAIADSMTWKQVVDTINASSISDVAAVSIVNGGMRFTSKITGANSSISLVDGATSGIVKAISDISGLYITTKNTPVSGAAATAPYVEISSSPENFNGDTQCNLPSGVYALTATVAGVQIPVSITVSGATQTWSNIITSLAAGLTTLAVKIVDNAIRFYAKETGSAVVMSITDGGTNGLIAALNNLTATTVSVKTRNLNYDHPVTETKVEFTEGTTTHTLSLVSDVEEGSSTLKLSGDSTVLESLGVNSILYVYNQTSWLAAGAKYYVSYKYNRPESEYNTLKVFDNFTTLSNDLGDNTPENDLVMWANLALNLYNNIDIAVVQLKSKTKSNFIKALAAIETKDVQDILPLSSDEDVRSYVKNHVIERSLPASKRYRMGWFGASAGTPVGSESDSNSLKGIAVGLKHERAPLINATRGLYYYDDPTTGDELSTLVDGSFIAAAIAAYRDSFADPTTSLLGQTIGGIDLLDDDYDSHYNEKMLQSAGESSVFLVAPSAAGGIYVVDDLTTDNSTVERNCINIITVKDYIAVDMAAGIDKTFKGSLVYNEADYESNLNNYIAKKMNDYKRNRIIAKVGSTSATRDKDVRTKFQVYYSYESIYVHKNTEGTFELI